MGCYLPTYQFKLTKLRIYVWSDRLINSRLMRDREKEKSNTNLVENEKWMNDTISICVLTSIFTCEFDNNILK